jgi:capsular exopolysaccharide synthesis family protein
MRLREARNREKLKVLLVTSPLAGDGKSTVVVNLADALSAGGKHQVLVVEGDLHHSRLAGTLGLSSWGGVAECLQNDGASPLSAVRRLEPLGWCLLPGGDAQRNPTELLQTPALGEMIQKLSASFEWILIDSPPALALTDAVLLQQHADASLVVVRAGNTPREAIEQTLALLGNKKVLGIILNGAQASEHQYYRHYYRSKSRGPAPADFMR